MTSFFVFGKLHPHQFVNDIIGAERGEDMRDLIPVLIDQRKHKVGNGIYDKLQVDFAYNSNHIEGSQLTHDQTRYIFETKSVNGEFAKVDDILETVNHFRCFDHILDTYKDELDEAYIKELHRILKTGTLSSESAEAVVGDYKRYKNAVGEVETTSPEMVPEAMRKLLTEYNSKSSKALMDIIKFHVDLETIHPFYDGNGRVGRLIMFKECLRNDILPFIISDQDKYWYSLGLSEWQLQGKQKRLIETIRLMQDEMEAVLDYFEIDKMWRGE